MIRRDGSSAKGFRDGFAASEGGGGPGSEPEDYSWEPAEMEELAPRLTRRQARHLRSKKRRNATRTSVEWAVLVGGTIIVAVLIKVFLFQAFYIPSESMVPTLQIGDRVIVNKMSYKLHDINRGDIVVFSAPDDPPVSCQLDPQIKELIKRVVALEGETIEIKDNTVFIDGKRLQEPYLPEGTRTNFMKPYKVPEGEVFVMGDNRANSTDSRKCGAIKESTVEGRAFLRFWPASRFGFL